MKTDFHEILKHKYFKLIVGLFLIGSSLHEMWGDFTSLSREQLNLLIGVILILDSAHDFISGTDDVLKADKSKDARDLLSTIKRIINSRIYHIAIGLVMVAGSIYDISEDYEKISEDHLEVAIGAIYILFSLLNVKEGVEEFDGAKEGPTH